MIKNFRLTEPDSSWAIDLAEINRTLIQNRLNSIESRL